MNTHKPRLAAPLKIKQVEEPSVILVQLLDCVIPAWSAGIQADMDVSGRIFANLMPAIHASMTKFAFSFSVGERKVMNHFVVYRGFRLIAPTMIGGH